MLQDSESDEVRVEQRDIVANGFRLVRLLSSQNVDGGDGDNDNDTELHVMNTTIVTLTTWDQAL